MAKGKKNARRDAYRAKVERRLAEMGYKPTRLRWQTGPGRLTVVIGDEMRDFALHAGQSIARTEYEMGKLDAWAEVLSLKPRDYTPVAAAPRKRKGAAPAQLDIEQLVAVSKPPNGAAHAARP